VAVEAADYEVAERYVLFDLQVESAFSTVYKKGTTVRDRWHR
jgi:hypothetical protein